VRTSFSDRRGCFRVRTSPTPQQRRINRATQIRTHLYSAFVPGGGRFPCRAMRSFQNARRAARNAVLTFRRATVSRPNAMRCGSREVLAPSIAVVPSAARDRLAGPRSRSLARRGQLFVRFGALGGARGRCLEPPHALAPSRGASRAPRGRLSVARGPRYVDRGQLTLRRRTLTAKRGQFWSCFSLLFPLLSKREPVILRAEGPKDLLLLAERARDTRAQRRICGGLVRLSGRAC